MKKIEPVVKAFRPYKPLPHPMQHRIDEFRVIPSLFTGGKAK